MSGYSLGGALATLASVDIYDITHSAANLVKVPAGGVTPKFELYTQGSPRVGDINFANGYPIGITYYRIVNGDDIVVHYPA